MNEITLTPVGIMAGLGVLIVLALVWRAGAKKARAAADAARSGGRVVSLAGRVLFNAALIIAVQWVMISYQADRWLILAALGVPALVASYTVTRALTVTTRDMPRRRGGGRR